MARYAIVNGDRIVGVVNHDGSSKHPYGDVTLKKLPDGISSEWVGKSYDEAVKAGNDAKSGDADIHPPKDAKEGRRAEELKAAEGGLHASGEVFNKNMGDATMAMEHPLDPVLGSEMRTPQPELHVAIVPGSQPKTADQTEKDAGRNVKPSEGIARHQPSTKDAVSADKPTDRAIAAAKASDTTAERKAKAGVT